MAQNKSKADNFLLKSQFFKDRWCHAEFLANINTCSNLYKPFYSLPVVCPIEGQDMIYLALRTERSIALLTIDKIVALKYQMEFGDSFLKKHNKISTFEFIHNPIKNASDKVMLVGFTDGLILMVELFTTKFQQHFNIIEDINKTQVPFRKSTIQKFCTIPEKEQFISLFQDSSILKYNLNYSKVNNHFIQEIQKHEEKIAFRKNLDKFPQKRTKIADNIELGVISQEHFECYCLFNKSEDPVAFYKFQCMKINDLVYLSPNSYIKNFIKNLDNSQDPLIVAYTGNDGYFRIVDLNNLQPLFLFKSNFGGMNSIVFENENSPLVALSCQDDSTIVLNISNSKYVRITGQTSFISRAIFQNIDKSIVRVISSSYDGSISIKEFKRQMLLDEDSQGMGASSKIPRKTSSSYSYTPKEFSKKEIPVQVLYDKKTSMELPLEKEEIIQINEEGIGFIECQKRIIFTSAFDACCSCWKFLDEDTEQAQQQQQQEQPKQQQNNTQNGQQQQQQQQR